MQDFNPISPLCGCCMFLENVLFSLCTMVTFQVSKDIKSGLSDIIGIIKQYFSCGTTECARFWRSSTNTTARFVALTFTSNSHFLCLVEMITRLRYSYLPAHVYRLQVPIYVFNYIDRYLNSNIRQKNITDLSLYTEMMYIFSSIVQTKSNPLTEPSCASVL